MRLSKYSAAAVMLALILGQSGYGDTGTESLIADEPAADAVVASDYAAETADETLEEQSDIGQATPVSYSSAIEPTPRVPRVASQPVGLMNYGHLPVGQMAAYHNGYQAQFASAAASQADGAGCDAGDCGCDDGSCGCDGGCDGGCGCEGGCGCAADMCCENDWCRHNRLRLFGEALYLRAGDAGVVYAEEFNGCDPVLSSPTGPVGVAETDFAPGFRAGFEVPFGCDARIVGAYTWYQADTTSNIQVLPTSPVGSVLRSRVTHPSIESCALGSQASSASYDLEFGFADLDLRGPIGCCCSCNRELSWIAGLRYGHLDQQFRSQQTIGAPFGLTDVATDITFDGVGIRLGLEGEARACNGLFIYGRGVANFVGGEFQANYQQTGQFGGTAVIANNFDEYRVVSILDAAIGVGWTSCDDRLRISGGYEVNAWLNALNTRDYIRGVQTGQVSGNGSGLTFDGVFLRVEFGL